MQQKIFHEESAGGVVYRVSRGKVYVALIQTRHARGLVWVLPKGHVEPHRGETIADAARREVIEELGIKDAQVERELGTTHLTFRSPEGLVKKEVHCFLLRGQGVRLRPQKEERILAARWFPFAKALAVLSYDTDRVIVRKLRRYVPEVRAEERRRRKAPKAISRPLSAKTKIRTRGKVKV